MVAMKEVKSEVIVVGRIAPLPLGESLELILPGKSRHVDHQPRFKKRSQRRRNRICQPAARLQRRRPYATPPAAPNDRSPV
jgi:hypothetical protein